MEKELQSKLVEILSSIQEATGKASDFAISQLPDIAQSYVVYGRAITCINFLCLLLAAVACFYAARYAFKNPWNTSTWSHEQDRKRSDSNVLVIGVGSVAGGLLLLIAVTGFNYLVWFSPKIWLLKEFARMVM